MKKKDNLQKYNNLSSEYPYFIYESYSISINNDSLNIEFLFNLADKYFFKPTLKFLKIDFYSTDKLSENIINNIVFNIGMIELVSYWKAACPPKIIIKPNFLNTEQIKWWKKLYFNGLGEFFYLNNLSPDIEDFVEIISDSENKLTKQTFKTINDVIVPIGGGKDSIVSLKLLLNSGKKILPFVLNPGKASMEIIEAAGFSKENIIEVQRTIHPQLLKLNELDFLNGHTPFSALLAFISVLSAILTACKNIALSNESSANEATISNTNINHQYSKSYEFEKDFRFYVNKYITEDINYFSFLRPLNELQIGKLFSDFSEYFNIFRSCNTGSKTGIWCGKCPKCLFTYIILSPFISQSKLFLIFNKNLFDDKKLLPVFNQLIGKEKTKPFECIGTIDEINAALCQTIQKINFNNLPFLLEYYKNLELFNNYKKTDFNLLLKKYNQENFINSEFEKVLISNQCID